MSMPAALRRRRDYAGAALFSYGFRPFFLAAALWAALGILLWLPLHSGAIALPTHLGPLGWHIHEMLYGYAAAAVAGFLLTAIPNWTGRLPVNGLPLAALAALWLAGRLAILGSATIGPAVAAGIDASFLAVLLMTCAREIVAGRNWRNLRVLAVVAILLAGNAVFHVEVLLSGAADYGIRIAIAAFIMLIGLVGGRIVPSFTNNWLVRNNPGGLPVPFSRFDAAILVASALALAGWVIAPANAIVGAAMIVVGVLQSVRLMRWAGHRVLADRLVLVLHVAYAFVPLGFLLTGLAALSVAVPPSAGLHAWTSGAIGMMTLAVMTRASLGHTGQPLIASAATQAIYGLAFAAAVLRIAAAFWPDVALLYLAALAWVAAFGGFVASFGPLLVRRPPRGAISGD